MRTPGVVKGARFLHVDRSGVKTLDGEGGQRNRRADSFLIEEMRRYNKVSSFDKQPIPDLNSEAIDFRAASEFSDSLVSQACAMFDSHR